MSNNLLGYNDDVKPIVQRLGGKTTLLKYLVPLLPYDISERVYCEPFLGGGAMLFCLQPNKAIVNDLDSELINVYETVRDNVDELIFELKGYKNTLDFFLAIRNLDRDKDSFNKLTKTQRAARYLFLNRTCFNGLSRYNLHGEFSSPFGYNYNRDFVCESRLRSMNSHLNSANITFLNRHYADLLTSLTESSFVYFDPPYYPISGTSNFTRYTSRPFTQDDQIDLYNHCLELDKRGVKFMLSNSNSDFIIDLYSKSSNFNITYLETKRLLNCDASKRGRNVKEIVVRNY